MAKYVVIGSNAFSGQDFVDLLLDDPSRQVIGLSRSAEKPGFMLRYSGHRNLANFRYGRLQFVLVPAGDHDVGAGLGVEHGDRLADPLAAAGDQRCPSVEFEKVGHLKHSFIFELGNEFEGNS